MAEQRDKTKEFKRFFYYLMSQQVKVFINLLIELDIIQSIDEAEVLARIAMPCMKSVNWAAMVDTAALRVAHKRKDNP